MSCRRPAQFMEVFIMAGTETRPKTSMQLALQRAGFEVPKIAPKKLVQVRTQKELMIDPLADILGAEAQEAAPAADWTIVKETTKEAAPAVDWVIVEDSQVAPAVEKPKKQKPKLKKEEEPKKIKLSKEEVDLFRRRQARKNRKTYKSKLILDLDGFTVEATSADAASLSTLYQANENWSWLAEPVLAIEVPGNEQSYQEFLAEQRRLAGTYKKACNEQVNTDGEKQFRRICRCCFLKSFKALEEVKTARRQAFEAGMPKEQRNLVFGKDPEVVTVRGYFTEGHEFLCPSCKGMKRGDAKSRACYPHQWQLGKLNEVALSIGINPDRFSSKDKLADTVLSKMKDHKEKPKTRKTTEELSFKDWLVKAEKQIDRLRRDLVGKPARNRNLQSQARETQKTAPAVDWAIVKSEAPAPELDWVIV